MVIWENDWCPLVDFGVSIPVTLMCNQPNTVILDMSTCLREIRHMATNIQREALLGISSGLLNLAWIIYFIRPATICLKSGPGNVQFPPPNVQVQMSQEIQGCSEDTLVSLLLWPRPRHRFYICVLSNALQIAWTEPTWMNIKQQPSQEFEFPSTWT